MTEPPVITTPEALEAEDPDLAALVRLIPGYDPWAQVQPGMYFDPELARFPLWWIPEWLKFHKGPKARQPFELDDWQRAILACLWGFRNEDGTRRYTTCFLYVGKKNGKTAFSAAVIVLVLATDKAQGLEAYSVASAQNQTANVFKHVAGMIKQQPAFVGRFRILGNRGGTVAKSVTDESTMSSYRVLCSDADTIDGVEPNLVVVDELHRHKTGAVMDVLRRSGRSVPNHLTMITTTADYNRESACNDELARARAVRDNTGDPGRPGFAPSYLPCIWEADKAQAEHIDENTGVAGWETEAIWRQANPGLGTIKEIKAMGEGAAEVRDLPSKLNDFLRLDLNVVTDTAEAWLDMAKWAACEPARTAEEAAAHLARVEEELRGQTCHLGLDLSRLLDQTAVALYFPETKQVVMRYWIPAERAKSEEKKHGIPYSLWSRLGLITLVPGEVIEFGLVEAEIHRLIGTFGVVEIGYDAWKAERLRQRLDESDIEADLVQMRQGAGTLGEATAQLEGLVVKGELRHGSHPILEMNARNCAIRKDQNLNIVPCKKSSTGPIDGIMALTMALASAIVAPVEQSLDDIYAEGETLDA